MPTPPTEEEFNAAADRVIASKPPAGLTEQQFFDLVTKELNRPPQPKMEIRAQMTGPESGRFGLFPRNEPATDESGKPLEPDTFRGGFLKSITDQIFDPANGKMFEHSAYPQGLLDLANLAMVPVDSTRSVAAGIVNRIPSVFKAASAEGPGGISGALSFPYRAYRQFKSTLPSEMAADAAKFRGPSGAVAPPATPPITPTKDILGDALRDEALRRAGGTGPAAGATSTGTAASAPLPTQPLPWRSVVRNVVSEEPAAAAEAAAPAAETAETAEATKPRLTQDEALTAMVQKYGATDTGRMFHGPVGPGRAFGTAAERTAHARAVSGIPEGVTPEIPAARIEAAAAKAEAAGDAAEAARLRGTIKPNPNPPQLRQEILDMLRKRSGT